MCGRYTLKTPVERLSEQFQFPKIIPVKPRYNIAPSQDVAVVHRLPDDRDRRLAMLRWGLIPAWVKDPAKARQPINAKAETVDKLPTFRVAFHRRRCLIPADGFYEWKQEGGRKQPVSIHKGEELKSDAINVYQRNWLRNSRGETIAMPRKVLRGRRCFLSPVTR